MAQADKPQRAAFKHERELQRRYWERDDRATLETRQIDSVIELIALAFMLLLFLVLVLLIWLTVSLLGLLVTLVVAGLVGWLAGKIAPGQLPYGWVGAVLAGLAGSWLGGVVLGDLGPSIGGIALIPSLLGAVALAFAVQAISKRREAGEEPLRR